MSIFSRFFGRKEDDDDRTAQIVANPRIENPLSLQVLFADGMRFDAESLTRALQGYHPTLSKARFEINPEQSLEGEFVIGLVGWGKHVIRIVGFESPMPSKAVEPCIAPSHYAQELKERARAHSAHVLLYYAGYETSSLEQYVALAAVAGVLSDFGAIVVLNESAHTSFPAAALSGADTDGDVMELLRNLPLAILYCGFVKYDVEGMDGVWMRTYGAHLLGLPDFAALAAGHHEGQRYFDMFENVLDYLRQSGARMDAGHTMQIGDDEFLRLRAPAEDEYFLESNGELFVAEIIGANEINRQ